MHIVRTFAFIFCISTKIIFAQAPSENYPVDPASEEQAGVPKGEVLKFTFENSKIFPGTWREYWVYVPAQYKPDRPACVYINQDGIQWKAPVVFDNLIYKGEMPVTIGVFVMHGKVRAANGNEANDRFNRSFEYDGLGDAYARFILDEILPEVERQKTSDGRPIRLSKNGNDRAIGGSSSGAVCAFTAAWERPDAFTRVYSAIGTYVGLRGADRYHTLVRKYEPKPVRIFLQDGANDLNIYAGDWWMANQTMLRALTFAGYEVKHQWGEGGHNGKHGTALFPEAMRFLWKDWPKPVKAGTSQNQMLSALLIPGQEWEQVSEGYKFTEGIAANQSGEIFYQDIPNSKTYKIGPDGKVATINEDSENASGAEFDKSGNRYEVAKKSLSIVRYDAKNNKQEIARDIAGNDLTVAYNGNVYVTAPDGREKPSTIYLIRPNGEKIVVDKGLLFANGVALSPDQTLLYATESASHWVWSFQVLPDGTLSHKQKFGWLHVRDNDENAWADGLTCDREGRIYVATRAGIQVLDQTGRVNAILPTPNGSVSNMAFGGKDFDTIYVTANEKIYRRKLNVKGANGWDIPNKPEAPKL
ncbi:SMP-30/gluconolactonase/LRE family protein [Dyadobacter chenwenxiniae]|uniref:SMP-30/gluconolactonase/LRE family protein n=1 Tax=Dyadobacter chenwenxiniae TaxID=2906456 RepID=A0A9X1TCN7_9BACT|nr:SMP-30/gluconolactonase/LRE family protein [Dyadobacter chenwenxiniae]MCF0060282.1 SMP-30/gluconolactonase/LRE family protein [Dyadobacter chenwenxiniae]UON86020.1 SMP-30/gluconolactonase/LRE family protein [Dyadobacter chenwenxiniae]